MAKVVDAAAAAAPNPTYAVLVSIVEILQALGEWGMSRVIRDVEVYLPAGAEGPIILASVRHASSALLQAIEMNLAELVRNTFMPLVHQLVAPPTRGMTQATPLELLRQLYRAPKDGRARGETQHLFLSALQIMEIQLAVLWDYIVLVPAALNVLGDMGPPTALAIVLFENNGNPVAMGGLREHTPAMFTVFTMPDPTGRLVPQARRIRRIRERPRSVSADTDWQTDDVAAEWAEVRYLVTGLGSWQGVLGAVVADAAAIAITVDCLVLEANGAEEEPEPDDDEAETSKAGDGKRRRGKKETKK